MCQIVLPFTYIHILGLTVRNGLDVDNYIDVAMKGNKVVFQIHLTKLYVRQFCRNTAGFNTPFLPKLIGDLKSIFFRTQEFIDLLLFGLFGWNK